MASKYILTRNDFLAESEISNLPIREFLTEIGEDLLEMLDRVKPELPESVSNDFIEKHQAYSQELENIGFKNVAKLEHLLYALGTSGLVIFEESNFQIQSVVDQYYKINEGIVDILRSIWNALTENGSPLGILHLVLDIIGFMPFTYLGVPIDVAADVINAIIYLFEGQYGSALISGIAAALPGIGDFAKVLKLSKGFKSINKIAEVAFKTGKADKKLVQILAKEDPGIFQKFISLFKGAKPVIDFFVTILKGIGRGIEAILRTWPISILFGKIGKSLGKWLDEAAAPITKNLDKAIDDMDLITKSSDDIAAALKAGDSSKVADTGTDLVKQISDELTAARAAGNAEEVNRLRRILQTRIEKGLPGAGQFVENGRLVDVVNKNLKATDEMLKDPAKYEKFLEEGFDQYVEAWKKVKNIDGVPFGEKELETLKKLKRAWIEGRKAEALFAGVKKLDDIPVDDLLKITGDAAAVSTKKGANFSARLINELGNDPGKLSKFFNGILADPRTLAKLEEAGPGVVGLYRLFAKNPQVYLDIAKAGKASIKNFENLGKMGGKWSQSIRTSRLARHRLIIAKHVIGAPLRCPFAPLGQGDIGGIDALALGSAGQLQVKGITGESALKFILSRDNFLFEEDKKSEENKNQQPTISSTLFGPSIPASQELEAELGKVEKENQARSAAVLGPVSYVDICQSHIAQTIDNLAITATTPPPALDPNNINTNDAAAITGSDAEINQQEAVNKTLNQMGIEAPLSDAGMLTGLPASANTYEVAQERISIDYKDGGLWYLLGGVMTGDLEYASVKSKINSELSKYEKNYELTVGNKIKTGEISLYPSPGEVFIIRQELKALDKDDSYSPRFFGPSISSTDISQMF